MDEKAHGIAIRIRPLTESSLIVHWLTPDAGRIATVAKGARRPKSAFLGKLDLLVSAEFSFVRSRRSELHTLREVVVTRRLAWPGTDLHALAIASYAINAVEQTTETDTPVPEIHALFEDLLGYLSRHTPAARAVFAFELKLLACLGLEPDPADTGLPPGAATLAAELLDADWEDLAGLTAEPQDARAVRQFLHGFLIHHLGRLPRGREQALHPLTPEKRNRQAPG